LLKSVVFVRIFFHYFPFLFICSIFDCKTQTAM